MCGIAGLMLDEAGPEAAIAGRAGAMAAGIAHRGPDGAGVWTEASAGLALAHRRLAIIDLSETGAQPMLSSSGRHAITYNGELYNYRELRAELSAEGAVFRGESDTEVLLEAWERWGEERTLGRLNGMFAFAIFDRRERQLALVRDPFGIKPLLWFRTAEGFFFASELKALEREPTCPRVVDSGSVAALLRNGCIPAPWTIYRDVRKLEPGSVLRLDASRAHEIHRYWSPVQAALEAQTSWRGAVFEDLVDQTDRIATSAVAGQMIADVPYGTFLSGGVDSSYVLALMQKNASRPVDSFTIGFEEKAWDESTEAAAIARHLGARHHVLMASGSDALALASGAADAYDEPFADSSQIPTLLLCRLTRKHVTMALSGDGGDEVFGGYQRYGWGMTLHRLRAVLPRPALQLAAQTLAAAAPLAPARAQLPRVAGLLLERDLLAGYRGFLAATQTPAAYLASDSEHVGSPDMQSQLSDLEDPLTRFQCSDAVSYLPDDILTKMDRASMSVGLEVRVPLLDTRLWRLGMATPPDWRRRKNSGKQVLRAALERYVPVSMIDRPKRGFAVPLAAWLRGPLRPFASDLMASAAFRQSGLFSLPAVERLWQNHLSGRQNHAAVLWSILMFAAWARRAGNG